MRIETAKLTLLPLRLQMYKSEGGKVLLLELTESVKRFGVFNPLLVRKAGESYEVIDGKKRYMKLKPPTMKFC
jgi:hypothetical protein